MGVSTPCWKNPQKIVWGRGTLSMSFVVVSNSSNSSDLVIELIAMERKYRKRMLTLLSYQGLYCHAVPTLATC